MLYVGPPRALVLATTLVAALVACAPLAAQGTDTLGVAPGDAPTQEARPSGLDLPPSPGGAFLRAVLLPGWGHASIGSYTRGAFYFAAEATTGILLARTLRRLARAEDALALAEQGRTEALLSSGTPADSVRALLDEDETLDGERGLVESRSKQIEDWVALGAFLVFLSGADAFVSAHLQDFPAPLSADVRILPAPGGSAAQLEVRVGVGPGRASPRR